MYRIIFENLKLKRGSTFKNIKKSLKPSAVMACQKVCFENSQLSFTKYCFKVFGFRSNSPCKNAYNK